MVNLTNAVTARSRQVNQAVLFGGRCCLESVCVGYSVLVRSTLLANPRPGGVVLALSWRCPGVVLVSFWRCPGVVLTIVLALSWRCPDDCPGVVLALSWHRPALSWRCPDIALRCPGVVLVSPWRCPGVVLAHHPGAAAARCSGDTGASGHLCGQRLWHLCFFDAKRIAIVGKQQEDLLVPPLHLFVSLILSHTIPSTLKNVFCIFHVVIWKTDCFAAWMLGFTWNAAKHLEILVTQHINHYYHAASPSSCHVQTFGLPPAA